jgi:hypothetical protein
MAVCGRKNGYSFSRERKQVVTLAKSSKLVFSMPKNEFEKGLLIESCFHHHSHHHSRTMLDNNDDSNAASFVLEVPNNHSA